MLHDFQGDKSSLIYMMEHLNFLLPFKKLLKSIFISNAKEQEQMQVHVI